MRKIKFRGKRLDDGEWITGAYLKTVFKDKEDSHQIYPPLYNVSPREVYPETIGQFTGVQDSKGTDVYEGDKFNISGIVYYVQYIADQCKYVLTTGFGYDTRNCFDLTCDSIFYETVIGNIHE